VNSCASVETARCHSFRARNRHIAGELQDAGHEAVPPFRVLSRGQHATTP
jgi:hypothetical protein